MMTIFPHNPIVATFGALPLAAADLLDRMCCHHPFVPRRPAGRDQSHSHDSYCERLLVFPHLQLREAGRAQNVASADGRSLNLFEASAQFFRTEVFRPAGMGDNADRFTPFLWDRVFLCLVLQCAGDDPACRGY